MYVVEMPVSIVKLDYDLTKAFFGSSKAKLVLRAVVSMAHGMELKLVAEGIETKEELMQAAEAEIEAKVEQLREEVKSADVIEKKQNNSFYEQPNSDKELEEFMRNYGIEDIDYSKYLDNITEENGGDAQ